jgi:hypothetical protein
MKYKHIEHSRTNSPHVNKAFMLSSLAIKPLFFTAIAWGLNTIGHQLGFLLIAGGHLAIIFYYISNLYLSSKKHASLVSKHI